MQISKAFAVVMVVVLVLIVVVVVKEAGNRDRLRLWK